MRLFREESFGPVVAVDPRPRRRARHQPLPTTPNTACPAAVFTRDVARGLKASGAASSPGICHVNGPTVHDEAQMPFGGVKGSGYGRFGGKAGIEAFTELRWITVDTEARPLPHLRPDILKRPRP